MSRHNVVIIKETHRGLLYEDGVLKNVLAAGRYQIPKPRSGFGALLGRRRPQVDVALVDVRSRDRVVLLQDYLTAEGASISATFSIRFQVSDARLAIHGSKNFEERVCAEAQTAVRRMFRGMSLGEILNARDEISDELLRSLANEARTFGVEVSQVDFKDLVIPEDYRKAMNLAVATQRLRSTQAASNTSLNSFDEADLFDGDPLARPDDESDHDGRLMFVPAAVRRSHEKARFGTSGGSATATIEPPLRRYAP